MYAQKFYTFSITVIQNTKMEFMSHCTTVQEDTNGVICDHTAKCFFFLENRTWTWLQGFYLGTFSFLSYFSFNILCQCEVEKKKKTYGCQTSCPMSHLIYFSIRGTRLVNELVCVSKHPVLWGQSHFIKMAAVVATFTGLYEHSRLLKAFSVWTEKSHWDCACFSRRTAASISAHTAVVGSIQPHTDTLPIGQVQ